MLSHLETSNLILDTDSYKASHWLQFPPDTTEMFAYLESRGGRDQEVLFFGLQYLLKRYLTTRVTAEMVKEADHFFSRHGLPFNREGWMRIAHDLDGRLPVRIRAVAEGTLVPTHNALMTVESTDPLSFWIVSWLETLLMRVWYPTTVATNSYHIKCLIREALEQSADDPEAELPFKLHDFGSRGVSSRESAAIGGMAHLVNFKGSDTVVGVLAANEAYNHPMAAFSIPAAEHSTITSWERNGECLAYANMLDQFAKPGALVAVVSDSYDLWNAIDKLWGGELREKVIHSGATVIIRPDSGDPATVVVQALQHLEARFVSTTNAKGFKVLNHVRVIQGDGINRDSVPQILKAVLDAGFSATNLAFGMGGGLLQQVDRDTQRFAYKCSQITRGGRSVEVFKAPVTDPSKASKKGKLDLIRNGDCFQTLAYKHSPYANSALSVVFENGELMRQYTLDEIRERAWRPKASAVAV